MEHQSISPKQKLQQWSFFLFKKLTAYLKVYHSY
ncbi:hypothetical protein BCEN4_740154 [Burkholderia cenocepacia]|nr:hypothetical protein BCEN4_740154 [Burkholderia cenocepacia]